MPILQPFGSINLPDGGKLPPAPSYQNLVGHEVIGSWVDVTCFKNTPGERIFIPVRLYPPYMWRKGKP